MRYKGFIVPRSSVIKRVNNQIINQEARVRLSWMEYYQKTGNARLTCRHFGISPDTFYRWKNRFNKSYPKTLEDNHSSRRPNHLRQPTTPVEVVELIKSLREQYPRWGKEKLIVLLKRQGYLVSSSTVGRTIVRLKQRGYLKEPIINYISAKKRYLRRDWAIRKPKDYQIKLPGDLIQLDTLDIRPLPNVIRKQFTARDVITKWDILEVYGHATSHLTARFLDTLTKRCPYPVTAIQIDGGSEFKGEFEQECKKRGIRLFVLPPRSPKLNGCVERSNRTHTEEFYEVNDFSLDLKELNQQLLEWEKIYNTVRPHQALGYLTPLEYITNLNKLERNVYGI